MRYGEEALSRMKMSGHLSIGLCAWAGNLALYETAKRFFGGRLEMFASHYGPVCLTYAAPHPAASRKDTALLPDDGAAGDGAENGGRGGSAPPEEPQEGTGRPSVR